MALVKVKPTSPGRRAVVQVVNSNLHKGQPFAALVESKSGKRISAIRFDVSRQVVVEDNAEAGVRYQKYEGQSGACLLRERMETGITCEHAKKFRVNRPHWDVEPDVNVFLKDHVGEEVWTAE